MQARGDEGLQGFEPVAPPRLGGGQFQRLLHQQRLQGHRRGRKDEGSGEIDQIIDDVGPRADQGAGDAQRLAARMQADHPVVRQALGDATAGRTKDAGAMRLIDDQQGVVAFAQGQQFGHRRHIAVHGIDRLDQDPGLGVDTARLFERRLETFQIVVPDLDCVDMRGVQPVAHAGMAQGIKDRHVVPADQGSDQCVVGLETIGEEQCRRNVEMRRGEGFEPGMGVAMAAQQTRAGRADFDAVFQRCDRRAAQLGVPRQAEIVVRRQVDAHGQTQAAATPFRIQFGQLVGKGCHGLAA